MAEDRTASTTNEVGSSPDASPFAVPQITLPKGGGAIRGIGEKFNANAITGTASLTVPIPASPGRSGFGPQLSLTYDSGTGNGPFGMGCALSLPAITRKTDKGLPRYRDDEESDVFILTGAEDLVPILPRDDRDEWTTEEFEREGYQVKRYRPRIEGLFAHIERWTRLDDGDIHWRSLSKDNVLTIYGSNAESRITDPANPRHTFSWLICQSYDDKGNAIAYEYAEENSNGVDLTRANERNRIRTANRYLKRVKYGNRRPLMLDPQVPSFRPPHTTPPNLDSADWMFELLFDYGEGYYYEEAIPDGGGVLARAATEAPPDGCWPVRPDAFSSYRAGFEVRTYRLCRRVLMFHHFPDELGVSDYLVRAAEFEYHEKALGSFIARITPSGYRLLPDGGYLKKSMPSLEMAYSSSPLEDPTFQDYEVEEVDIPSVANLPGGIDGARYRWIDLDGEGISGVLSEQAGAWFYKPNLGQGRFGTTETVAAKPSLAALESGRQEFLDLAGDGNLDLVQLAPPTPGYYERTLDAGGWAPFRPFPFLPLRNWNDPNLKFIDVTGDGLADVLITEDDAFAWHPSLNQEGFGAAVRVHFPLSEEGGPRVLFADGSQSVYLADMSGDGLTDIVRIRNGEVCYWPNIGYGRFGPKVTMDKAPWFAGPDLFDQRRIRLADTDGSGTTDIIYLGHDGVRIYLNETGQRWSAARTLSRFPAVDNLTAISVVDFLGRGTACLLWSSPLPGDERRPLRYVDLMCGQKPHLLTCVRNNLGAETVVEYASSTEFYLADKAAGAPWVTRLAFPVHVVRRVETYDSISRNRFVTRYVYHHGYFDGPEREFRGFGMVEQLDTEEMAALEKGGVFPAGDNENAASNVPPVLTKTWFHTGAFLAQRGITRQFEHEYYGEPPPYSDNGKRNGKRLREMLLEDSAIPDGVTPQEAREACRALKGSILRQEVYALDGGQEAARPYTVTENNYTIRLIQPRGRNRHAVFFTHARETLTLNYERKLYEVAGRRVADPRIGHRITLEVDAYGNVVKAVTVGYGRLCPDPSPLLTDTDRAKQGQMLLTLTENSYTNPVLEADAYRVPLSCETRQYELIKLIPAARWPGVTNRFRFEELADQAAKAGDGGHDLPYEDANAEGATGSGPYRRLLKHSRAVYRSDRLDRLLPLGTVEALALPGSNYSLAFTPRLLKKVYRRVLPNQPPEDLLPDPASILHDQGGYVDLDADGRWWTPSGELFYSPSEDDSPAQEMRYAAEHFFLPHRFRDPFGNVATAAYDAHDLQRTTTRDPLGNTTQAQHDYRVLAPRLITDPNGNRAEAAFDALGMLAGTAVMGKESQNEGDSLQGFVADLDDKTVLDHIAHPLRNPQAVLQNATMRFLYDLFGYQRTRLQPQPQPAAAYSLQRETHAADLKPGEQTKIQHHFSYSDGLGRAIQKKQQAEPGPLNEGGPEVSPRWVGSGWTIFNNKGKPVRQYEPFFSSSHAFEFARRVGVSPILCYDPVGRNIVTIHPDHSWEKVVFDPWGQETWDRNDTVVRDPRTDGEAGGFFTRLADADYLPTWYGQRIGGGLGPREEEAAVKSAAHADTPTRTYFDSLGRGFLVLADNGPAGQYATRTELDTEGNQRAVLDALGRIAARYDYDLLSHRIHQSSMEAGQRWLLNDVSGKALYAWDSRGHTTRTAHDALRRPTTVYLRQDDSPEILVGRTVYGESQTAPEANNLRGKVVKVYDGAGVVASERYDFKGNLLTGTRQLAVEYRTTLDWSQPVALQPEVYHSAATYDALNRPIQLIAPHVAGDEPRANVTQPSYNEANLLEKVDVWLRRAGVPSGLLDPATADLHAVTNLDYNAKGQRALIEYGNGVRTHYDYDPSTFRLRRILTRRQHDDLQDLHYTYDPTGNITHIRDDAQQTIYFRNRRVDPSCDYTYDAIYRLIAATGREHLGQGADGHNLPPTPSSPTDAPRVGLLHPGDGNAMGRYLERYGYDAVGNILEVSHRGGAPGHPGWTRIYDYAEPSQLEPSQVNNRLSRTQVGDTTERYEYAGSAGLHGDMTSMPHLPRMEWDYRDQLQATTQQAGDDAEVTYYVYDAGGERVRKVTERAAGSKAHERIYLGAFEIYREYDGVNETSLERETFHVMDDKQRIALIESRTRGEDGSPVQLIRYQYGNHLGSVSLELDDTGQIISYEEYTPYGSTSYQAARSQTETPKRYRYTGKERDEESKLYYFGARYYAPWLGRWMSADPTGLSDGPCQYAYVLNNPISRVDPNGRQSADSQEMMMGMMWTQMGRELSGMVESIFGGHAYIDPVRNKVDYTGPQGGVGGAVGGAVRAATLRAVPVEKDPTPASLQGLVVGASIVPILDPGARLVTGKTVTGQDTSRGWAAVQFGLDVLPLAMEAHALSTESRFLALEEEASSASVSLAFKPGTPGHNMVGVNLGEGTQWSHLVVGNARNTSGVITNGRAIIEIPEHGGPSPKYLVVEIPVSPEQAQKAMGAAQAQLDTGDVGQYQLLCTDCSSYAGQVLKSAGVATPPVKTPALNYVSAVMQSPQIVTPLHVAASATAAASVATRTTELEEKLQRSIPSEHLTSH